MKTIFYAMCLAIGLFSVSCKKKAADVNREYVGYWTAYDSYDGSSILIESDSKAVYETSSGAVTKTLKGKARVKGNTLKIFTKKFSIDQAPMEDTLAYVSVHTMVLDGVTYVKH